MQSTALLHLLQLVSPSLPIGGFSYSQGLEVSIERGLVKDESSARGWIVEQVTQVLAQFELPLTWRLMQAFSVRDFAAVRQWNEIFLASRDTAEFRAETVQMGYSLRKLLLDLKLADAEVIALLQSLDDVPLPTMYACIASILAVPLHEALLGMVFSWVENQVLVCVKSVPLGQVAGQRVLLSLRPELEAAVGIAQKLRDDELNNWAPGLSMLSMQHEVQYSRLYRS